MIEFVNSLGQATLRAFAALGHAAYFSVDLMRYTPASFRRFGLVIAQIYAIGYRSLTIILASGFAALILKFLMEISPRFDPLATGVTVLLAALIAAASGWAASFRTLGRKPLEILREE